MTQFNNQILPAPPLKKEGKTPKTGLAFRMREWMRGRTGTKAQRRFTMSQICQALGAGAGKEREAVIKALADFAARDEVAVYWNAQQNLRQYLYMEDWHAVLKGHINRKIYKAMYISNDFAVTDVQRLTGLQERDYIDKLISKLRAGGHLAVIGRRLCAHGAGAENIYHVAHRDKFKLEVMR